MGAVRVRRKEGAERPVECRLFPQWPMDQTRARRVAQLMQRELGQMLLTEVKDPRVGFVSVTRVEVSRDLGLARAFISVLGTDEEKEATLAGLKKAATFLRGELGRRLRLRKSPELVFQPDEGIKESLHIQDLIRSLGQDGSRE